MLVRSADIKLWEITADRTGQRRYMRLHRRVKLWTHVQTPKPDPISTDALGARRRRAIFRAWHRGMKEMDLLLGRYADTHVATMDETMLTEFETLMEVADRDLFQWFTGEAPVPAAHDTALLRAICAFHAIDRA